MRKLSGRINSTSCPRHCALTNKCSRLDKNVFHEGFADLQSKLEERYYTTTLVFAQDLCHTIHTGLNTDWKPPPPPQARLEPPDVSPTKQTFSDPRERRRLGKRILKAVQSQLEAALRIESDVTSKPYHDLQKELEGIIEAGLELSQSSITVSDGDRDGDGSEDVIMVDAPGEPEITVASVVNADDVEDEADDDNAIDTMDTAEATADDEGNIEVNTSSLERVNGVGSSNASVAEKEADSPTKGGVTLLVNGVKSSATPPETNGYVALPRPSQPGPPTPPQSNGSFGKETPDVLTEGGILWYLKPFEPQGLSIVEEQWAGRDAVRSLSEELTDIDDDELKGLGLDINGSTITATPVGGQAVADTVISVATKSRSSKVRKRARTSGRRR